MNDGGAQVWTRDFFVLCDSTDRGGTYLDGSLKAEIGEGLKKEQTKNEQNQE